MNGNLTLKGADTKLTNLTSLRAHLACLHHVFFTQPSTHEIMYFLHFKVPGLADYCVSRGLHFHATLCDLSENVKDIHPFMYHFTV